MFYLRLGFRVQARPKPPTCTLSFLFHSDIKACQNYLRFIRISDSLASKRRPPGNVSFQHLVPELSSIYYDSIKQQERSFLRQL